MNRLADTVAWVSGAASGMGEATARLFAREGAKVAVVDIDQASGEAIAQDIGGLFIRCDVSLESDVRHSFELVAERFGPVGSIVNSAGIVHVAPLHEYSEERWDQLLGVNVKSIFFSTKHGIDQLRMHRRSYIVNIGSVGSFVGQPSTPAYTASKGAVLQLSRSIALDYAADGVRCNCICPGITDTPMFRYHMRTMKDPEAALAARLRRVPMGVALTPEDIARSVLYFCCEDSAGITGTSLTIDGGYLAAAEWDHGGQTRFMET